MGVDGPYQRLFLFHTLVVSILIVSAGGMILYPQERRTTSYEARPRLRSQCSLRALRFDFVRALDRKARSGHSFLLPSHLIRRSRDLFGLLAFVLSFYSLSSRDAPPCPASPRSSSPTRRCKCKMPPKETRCMPPTATVTVTKSWLHMETWEVV